MPKKWYDALYNSENELHDFGVGYLIVIFHLMIMEKFDAIIIGTGQAGPSLAARCAAEGLKTAIIERDKFGGTCVNDGCTPTKTMVASARVAFMARRAKEFGVVIDGDISIDMKKIVERKDALVQQSSSGVESWLKNTENLTVIEGHARFEDNHTINVNGNTIQGDKIFINVGGRARIPEGYEGVDILTNTSILELDLVPEHLIIVGGSYIGLEFGQMFRRFGSKVTIVEKADRLVKREDEDVSTAIQDILMQEDINIRLNAACISGEMKNNKVVVDVDCENGDRRVEGSHLLLAVGRVPNTDDLGIENTDISLDERGFIEVTDELQTTATNIWAMGDCNGEGAFTHTAYNDFEIVAANLFDDDPRSIKDRILCYGLYIDPALARIGMTEAQVRESGKKALITTRPMIKISRAREKGETNGFMKILVDAETKEILGASILGIEGDEIIHSLLDVMYAKAPYTVIQRAVHIHPTVSELIPTALAELKPLS